MDLQVEKTFHADENDNNTTTSKSVKSGTSDVTSMEMGDKGGEPKVEKLEVPSAELKSIQKQVLIEKLMSSIPPTNSKIEIVNDEEMEVLEDSESKRNIDVADTEEDNRRKRFRRPAPPRPRKEEQPRKTFKMRSSILDRVKTFLPEFKTANDTLIRLPDPSKLSLESDSDETDGSISIEVAGTSADAIKASGIKTDNKPYVEMNLALFEESGSDTSSDDEDNTILTGKVKGLPNISKKSASPSPSPSPQESVTEVEEYSPETIPVTGTQNENLIANATILSSKSISNENTLSESKTGGEAAMQTPAALITELK